MNFCEPPDGQLIRQQARDFLRKHLTDDIRDRAHHDGSGHNWGFHRAIADRGWIGAEWPKEDGGLGWDAFEMLVLLDELHRAGAPLDGWSTTMMAAGTLRLLGSDEQKADVLPSVLSGEALICLGFSEPDAGSDVAAARTRAVRDGDTWLISGQKMFTTLAHEARWVFLLTRTNQDGPKHAGLTMFLVPMDSPGISLSAIHTLGGERTNITFYDSVRVDDRCRVGGVGDGWQVLTTALTTERGSAMAAIPIFVGAHGRLLDRAIAEAARPRSGGRLIDNPTVRQRLAASRLEYEVSKLLGYRSVWVAGRHGPASVEAAMAKLSASEHFQRASADLLDIFGPAGLLQHGEEGAPADGWIEHAHRHAAVTTIYGGTSEIMRTIIADHKLKLPRSR